MFNPLDIIGTIQNVLGGIEVGLGWWLINRIMSRVFG